MIMQPDLVTAEMFADGLRSCARNAATSRLCKATPGEIRRRPVYPNYAHCPYATEMETIAKMDDFASANGFAMHGRHHEIYMGDPRKAAPEKLKTVLRHPVQNIS